MAMIKGVEEMFKGMTMPLAGCNTDKEFINLMNNMLLGFAETEYSTGYGYELFDNANKILKDTKKNLRYFYFKESSGDIADLISSADESITWFAGKLHYNTFDETLVKSVRNAISEKKKFNLYIAPYITSYPNKKNEVLEEVMNSISEPNVNVHLLKKYDGLPFPFRCVIIDGKKVSFEYSPSDGVRLKCLVKKNGDKLAKMILKKSKKYFTKYKKSEDIFYLAPIKKKLMKYLH